MTVRTSARDLVVLVGACLALAACGDNASQGESGGLCVEDSDCGAGAVCIAGACFGGEADAEVDAEDADEPDVDDTPDVPPAPDVPDVPLGAGFGEPCERDVDCESGYCIDTDDGRVCTVPCTETCPDPDWECRLLPGQGADLVRLCVPRVDDVCEPCSGDVECGGLGDLCLSYEDGRFCGRACETSDDCREGYQCDEVADGQGGFSRQCVNELGICGDCLDRDGDGFGEGEGCRGFDCDDESDATYEGAPELCDGLDNDCDDIPDEGFNLISDVNNCGGCGLRCSLLRAAPVCVAGVCEIGSCLPGYYDANGLAEDGCEYACTPNPDTGGAEVCNGADDDCDGVIDNGFDLETDALNCGRCGTACALESASALCEAGVCVVDACTEPFADCNALDVDGCEVDTTTDADHCGACGQECALRNAQSRCEDASCVIASCNEPWLDCDLDPSNGCEVNALTDDANCGLCGNVCDTTGGLGACSSGECTVDLCGRGLADCDARLDNGCETNIDEDPANCGACGFVCELPNATPICQEGRCRVGACAPGFYNINGLNEDGCEYACTPTGPEICDERDNDCDGVVDNGFDLDSDIENCGGCGQLCNPAFADAICNAGECVITRCELGFDDCNSIAIDGCETAVGFDPLNCGGCGVVCDLNNASAECFGRTCVVDECVAPWQNCDTNPANGCEANLDTSEAHCGTCFSVCSVAGGVGLCDEGNCGVGACNGDLANCDGRVDNGCEIDLGSNPLNCGGCGVTCAAPNASTRCVDRGCELLSCDPGFRDCDGVYGTGCEANINNSVANCGGCGNTCSLPNAESACVTGSCTLFDCDANFANCDGLVGNGCETNLLSDPNNCGRCGESCEVDNGAGFCSLGICQIGLCEGTFANCDFDPNNGCESNLATDPFDCGRCGNRCNLPNATAACSDGGCVVDTCAPGWGNCDGLNENGCEVNLDESPEHCGRCGLQCLLSNADAACVEGNCQVDTCDTGFGDCDLFPLNGCEVNLTSADDDCGACGFDCSLLAGPETVCVNRVCEVRDCLGTTRDCDGDLGNGCEVDVATDLANCGGCGSVCNVPNATEQCVAGVCSILDCAPGFLDCDGSLATGCEVNINSDPRNCGGCGNNCDLLGAEEICIAGTCTIGSCQGTNEDCNNVIGDGCEANLAVDPLNCGGCGQVCNLPNSAEVCAGGFCAIGECLGSWWDCNGVRTDGCEVNLGSDVNNCGGCGFRCDGEDALSICLAGFCQVAACDPGRGDCDTVESNGCEVDLLVDTNNCGTCGEVCNPPNASPVCDDGSCEILECIGAFEDCDGFAENGCEANTNNSLAHCGGCGQTCNLPGAAERCSFGSCVFDGCEPGFIDLNNDTRDGCEYACTVTSAMDAPDPLFRDANCDGVDGMLEQSVFVWSGGSNLNSGLRPDVPVATLDRALVIAGALPERTTILVATGAYDTTTALVLRSGVSIYGGYSSDFVTRSTTRPTVSSTFHTAVRADGLTAPVEIYGINFVVADRTTPGEGAFGFWVRGSGSFLTLTEVDITAGRGAPGASGADGTDGTNGVDGRNASGASAGGGGTIGGGNGGAGRRRNTGLPGASGNANGSACGGSPGGGGNDTGCFDGNPPGGRPGGNGCAGSNGANGAGGNGFGVFSGFNWTPANGSNGTNGTNGGAGGGGGGGGGEDCNVLGICVFCGTGRGGGGGGGGGALGTAGTGGGGGGASVGIRVEGSTVNVDNVVVRTTGGGAGGRGGARGEGGLGGDGGNGATSSSGSEGDGGPGGDGGDGGDGGCGGGGAGGPSLGVWGSGGAAVRRVGVLNTAPGSGGAGGPSCGVQGAAGTSAATRDVTLF